jgi:hypothetical protein
MKYTAILTIIWGLYFLWQFVSAVIERGGLPTRPLYYIASVVEIGLGIMTYRWQYKLQKANITKGRPFFWIFVIMLLCIAVPVVFYNLNIEFLRPMGGTQMWYIFTTMAFLLYIIVKRKRSGVELTIAEKKVESINKINVFISIVVIIILILPKF